MILIYISYIFSLVPQFLIKLHSFVYVLSIEGTPLFEGQNILSSLYPILGGTTSVSFIYLSFSLIILIKHKRNKTSKQNFYRFNIKVNYFILFIEELVE